MVPISYNNICLILANEGVDPSKVHGIDAKKDIVMCPSCFNIAARPKSRTHRNDFDFVTY